MWWGIPDSHESGIISIEWLVTKAKERVGIISGVFKNYTRDGNERDSAFLKELPQKVMWLAYPAIFTTESSQTGS